jgi:glycosyltransferase involved in cell wall biosynthesis
MSSFVGEPLFSVCIPQFNRTSFLLRSLHRLHEQMGADFEVCISDGGSTDGRAQEIVGFLHASRMSYKYEVQKKPAPYDQNLRTAIGLARGHYCFLLGNDDMLPAKMTLQHIGQIVETHEFPEVVVTNYHELSTGRDFRRVLKTDVMGKGVEAAVSNFRNYSFVSGILLNRELAQKHATEKWDGSEMYQTFLATRILAGGGRLLGIADTVVLKDIQIEGEQVDSYARRERVVGPIKERVLPLAQLGRVVVDAMSAYVSRGNMSRVVRNVFRQLLLFTYPPWLVEYRRVQSWQYAAGVALGMRPRNILKGIPVNWPTKLYLRLLYGMVTVAGLVLPVSWFGWIKPRRHQIAQRRGR